MFIYVYIYIYVYIACCVFCCVVWIYCVCCVCVRALLGMEVWSVYVCVCVVNVDWLVGWLNQLLTRVVDGFNPENLLQELSHAK